MVPAPNRRPRPRILHPMRPCGWAPCHVVSLHARLPLASEHGECSCRRRRAAHSHTRRRRRRVVVLTSVDDRSSRSGARAGLCSAQTTIALRRCAVSAKSHALARQTWSNVVLCASSLQVAECFLALPLAQELLPILIEPFCQSPRMRQLTFTATQSAASAHRDGHDTQPSAVDGTTRR